MDQDPSESQIKENDPTHNQAVDTKRTFENEFGHVEYEGFGDGLLYFLTAFDLSKKINIIELPSILEKWGEQDPLSYISLFSPRIFNTFI